MARAIAHLAAVAIKRAELIEGLTNANIVKDLFEALAAGATTFAVAKATEVRCDLTKPYVMLCAEPADGREQGSGSGGRPREALGQGLAELAASNAVEAGPGPVRALLALDARTSRKLDEVLRALPRAWPAVATQRLGSASCTPPRATRPVPTGRRSTRPRSARALLAAGGAVAYSEVGAYRYLVHIGAEDAPHDRMRAAVDCLIEYDRKRRTALLDTLERYLTERRSVIESARALFIHPNTLRQRLGRIEELTGLSLDQDDLLSLELAIKLARLHGRP